MKIYTEHVLVLHRSYVLNCRLKAVYEKWAFAEAKLGSGVMETLLLLRCCKNTLNGICQARVLCDRNSWICVRGKKKKKKGHTVTGNDWKAVSKESSGQPSKIHKLWHLTARETETERVTVEWWNRKKIKKTRCEGRKGKKNIWKEGKEARCLTVFGLDEWELRPEFSCTLSVLRLSSAVS